MYILITYYNKIQQNISSSKLNKKNTEVVKEGLTKFNIKITKIILRATNEYGKIIIDMKKKIYQTINDINVDILIHGYHLFLQTTHMYVSI